MLDPTLEDAIRERMRSAPFAAWLGMELASLDEGTSEIRLRLETHHLNPGGIAHGGVIASILDSAIGLALRTTQPLRSAHVTLQLQINYLKAARPGVLVARGVAVRSGERVQYGEGTLSDEAGGLLARAAATFLVIADPTIQPGDVLA